MSGRLTRTSAAGACVLFLVFVSSLASAGGSVHVARAPGRAPIAGHAWVVKLLVRPASFNGALRLVATGPRPLVARARGGRGVYRARLVFPQTGTWKLAAVAGGSRSRLGSIRVRPAPPVIFDQPTGVDVAPDGSLLVVEFGRQRLVRVRPVTGRVTPVATFAKPWGVARAPSGSIFVSDQGSLERIDGDDAPTTVFTAEPGLEVGPIAVAPNGDAFCATAFALYRLPQGQPGTPERLAAGTAFSSPHGLTIASDGAVLVADTNNNRILRVDPATGAVKTFAELGHPRGIDVAADGSVYVSAADEGRVVHLSANGNRIAAVGPLFADPYALAVGQDGSVYAIDAGPRGLVRRIAPG
jgi:streptogramin lyase